jgi:hypothetical protein
MSNTEPFVTVFEGNGITAEMEAQSIHALLESSGIESLLVRENVTELPVGNVDVRVVGSQAERAFEIIKAGRAGGPEAADEAEAETEI